MINFEQLQLLLILERTECHSEVISTMALRYTQIILSSDPSLAQVSLRGFSSLPASKCHDTTSK